MTEEFFVPDGVCFHLGHTWARIEGKDAATIGMDDFAQKLAGRLDMVEFPRLDQSLMQGEKAWTLRFGAKAVDMLSPVDGVVTAINRDVVEEPETVNSDPYGKGWLVKVKSPNLRTNLKSLLSGDLARRWIEVSMEKLRLRSGDGLQDGGVPAEGIARNVDGEKWDDLLRDFFLTSE